MELLQEGLIVRVPDKPFFEDSGTLLKSEVGIFDLINAFQKVLRKIESKREDLREIFEESFTVSDKIDFIMRTVPGKTSVTFSGLFASAASRTEIAVTFLALLELIRMNQIRVFQDGLFTEIEIRGFEPWLL